MGADPAGPHGPGEDFGFYAEIRATETLRMGRTGADVGVNRTLWLCGHMWGADEGQRADSGRL